MKYKRLLIVFFTLVVIAPGVFIFIVPEKPLSIAENIHEDQLDNNIFSNEVSASTHGDKFTEICIHSLYERLAACISEKSYFCSVYVKELKYASQPLVINNKKIRAASMIKIFIMAEAFRQEKEGLLSLDEEHIITNKVKVSGAGILQGAREGERKKLGELIELMIIESDNTATNMIIDRLSMENINKLIVKLGFHETLLQRKMMDLESIKNGKENYTSAVEVGLMLEKIYRGQCIGVEQDAAMLKILMRQQDNDKIPGMLPVHIKVAHKTGELIGAIHDGGIVYGERRDYIVCFMTENVNDPQATVSDMASLSEFIYQSLNKEEGTR